MRGAEALHQPVDNAHVEVVPAEQILLNRGIDVRGSIRAEGDLDFRGTMGVGDGVPVGFTAIRLQFDLESEAPAEDLAALIETTERYCVVLQTLAGHPDLSVARI